MFGVVSVDKGGSRDGLDGSGRTEVLPDASLGQPSEVVRTALFVEVGVQDAHGISHTRHASNPSASNAAEITTNTPAAHRGVCACLGMVYEARGQKKQAAVCYRKVIEFVRQHPQQYDPDFEKAFQGRVAELDPPAAI